jgi:twinkle protein
VKDTDEALPAKQQQSGLIPGSYAALPARHIDEESCRKFGYRLSKDGRWQIADYRDSAGKVVAQKLKDRNKNFHWKGSPKRVCLWGQHLWQAVGKTALVITEGEIDALSVSQVQGHEWPVVSLQNGAQGAKKAIAAQFSWVTSFHKVVLFFDNDDPGREAAAEVAAMLPVGKAYIAAFPDHYKDANDALRANDQKAIINAIRRARKWSPEGIWDIGDLIEQALIQPEIGLPWWDERLTAATYGRRWGELYALGAGTGVGKTDWLMQQIAFDVSTLNQNVGVLFLEQHTVETAQRIAGKIDGAQYHLPNTETDRGQLRKTLESLGGRVKLYDSWGNADWEGVEQFIRFVNATEGTKIFYLDHLTAMADPDNERASLERIMKAMARLTNELKIIVTFVSHLATPEGKPHEEGGRVMARHFKGARAIAFWSFFMFGLERNTQAEDPNERDIGLLRVIKDRFTGQATGKTFHLRYDPITGLLNPIDPDVEALLTEEF